MECDKNVCETQDASTPCAQGVCKMCGVSCGGDPIACAQALWFSSFCQAMRAAQVDILKTKIQKAWGPKMEKAADAVLEAMGTKWQSMLADTKAKSDLHRKLSDLWSEK